MNIGKTEVKKETLLIPGSGFEVYNVEIGTS